MRTIIVNIVLLISVGTMAYSQSDYKLMDWKTQYTHRTYLLQEMHKQYDVRRERIKEALASKTLMEAYQKESKKRYLEILGELPEKSALNPTTVKVLKQEKYQVENVIYEALPNQHVTANFYVPNGAGPFPAVLLPCGHEMTSKATESYQKTAALFAENGFAVLVVDPISQGERVQFLDKNGKRILRGSTTEHTLLNAGANLVGNNVATYELYDNIRSLDYLCTRTEVDTTRLGCVGNSGGGAQTLYLIAFDNRIKVAAPCSNFSKREINYEFDGTADGCQQIPFEGKQQLEISDLSIMFAPKPIMILAGRYDFFNYTGTEKAFRELKSAYKVLGATEKATLTTIDDGHGISKPKREAVVQWFVHWFRNEEEKIKEKELNIFPEEALNCIKNGQVGAAFPNELTIQQINLQKAENLSESRKKFKQRNNLSGYQEKIKELLAIQTSPKAIKEEKIGVENHPNYTLTKTILRVQEEVPLPCLIYRPKKQAKNSHIELRILEEGKKNDANNNTLIQSVVSQGNVLVLADLRGMGETREKKAANEWKYYNKEYHNATLSLHVGKPIVGQRVTDILTLVDYIATHGELKNSPIKIYATGAASHPALYASVFRKQIRSIAIVNSISTYYNILNKPMELDWYSYVVPDVLKWLDIPDVVTIKDDIEISFTKEKTPNKKVNQK